MKRSLGDLVQRALAGFAAGVMVAASIWSLLIPAIEQSEGMGKLSFLPCLLYTSAFFSPASTRRTRVGLVQMFSASASLLRERPQWLRQTSAWTAR